MGQTHPRVRHVIFRLEPPSRYDMRALIAGLLSMAALVIVLTTAVNSSNSYTTHIGSRIPPVDAGCIKDGEFRTDEGKLLRIFRCPV